MTEFGGSGDFTVIMEGPFGASGSVATKLTNISLPSASWKGGESPYSQIVSVEGISVNSMVNLHPSVEQLEVLRERDVVFTAENDGGVVTVYAIGDKPTEDYTFQATVMEVVA